MTSGQVFAIISLAEPVSRLCSFIWGYSSAGRALEWHSRGQRFDPAYLHHEKRQPDGCLFCFHQVLRALSGKQTTAVGSRLSPPNSTEARKEQSIDCSFYIAISSKKRGYNLRYRIFYKLFDQKQQRSGNTESHFFPESQHRNIFDLMGFEMGIPSPICVVGFEIIISKSIKGKYLLHVRDYLDFMCLFV